MVQNLPLAILRNNDVSLYASFTNQSETAVDLTGYTLYFTTDFAEFSDSLNSSGEGQIDITAAESLDFPLGSYNYSISVRKNDESVTVASGQVIVQDQAETGSYPQTVAQGELIRINELHLVSNLTPTGGAAWVTEPTDITLTAQGEPGEPGQGLVSGGEQGFVIQKASRTDYATEWVTQSDIVSNYVNQFVNGGEVSIQKSGSQYTVRHLIEGGVSEWYFAQHDSGARWSIDGSYLLKAVDWKSVLSDDTVFGNTTFIGNFANQAASIGRQPIFSENTYFTMTVTGSGDIFMMVFGRASNCSCSVVISQNGLLISPAYTVSSPDLTAADAKKIVKIGKDLPYGTYQITCTSNGGITSFWPVAVGFEKNSLRPSRVSSFPAAVFYGNALNNITGNVYDGVDLTSFTIALGEHIYLCAKSGTNFTSLKLDYASPGAGSNSFDLEYYNGSWVNMSSFLTSHSNPFLQDCSASWDAPSDWIDVSLGGTSYRAVRIAVTSNSPTVTMNAIELGYSVEDFASIQQLGETIDSEFQPVMGRNGNDFGGGHGKEILNTFKIYLDNLDVTAALSASTAVLYGTVLWMNQDMTAYADSGKTIPFAPEKLYTAIAGDSLYTFYDIGPYLLSVTSFLPFGYGLLFPHVSSAFDKMTPLQNESKILAALDPPSVLDTSTTSSGVHKGAILWNTASKIKVLLEFFNAQEAYYGGVSTACLLYWYKSAANTHKVYAQWSANPDPISAPVGGTYRSWYRMKISNK